MEVVEVAILAIVAVATAWSGYQATRWDGQQSLLYGHATRDRFAADSASTRAGQELVGDSAMFNGWLQARSAGDTQLMAVYVRRFTPPYRVAFDAWLQTDPFNNPQAPPGPGYMPQYHNPLEDQANQLNAQATAEFDQGTEARETGDKYVRDTVLFASVLFLVAIAQRFKYHACGSAPTSSPPGCWCSRWHRSAVCPARSAPSQGNVVDTPHRPPRSRKRRAREEAHLWMRD